MKLNGKVAVITGGSSGIGLATAKLFEREGATVIITGRNRESLDSASREIGSRVIAIRSDTSNLDDIRSLFSHIREKYGRIDVLFLNAGVAPFAPMEMVNEEFYDNIMNINVKGLYFSVKEALPLLKHGSSVIITSSIANQMGMAGGSVYSASKAAVRSFARSMSAELVGKGIRVNIISPGAIDTPIFGKMGMSEEQKQGMLEGFKQMNPMKRFGQPEEIAKAALFLATDDSSYVLGGEIIVDGGQSHL